MRVKFNGLSNSLFVCTLAGLIFCACGMVLNAQIVETPRPAPVLRFPPALVGQRVEQVRITGNADIPSAVVLNVVRTREGEPFDPATVEEDYERIFALKKFSNVQPIVETTNTGVIVVFRVTEPNRLKLIEFRGNQRIEDSELQNIIGLKPGEAVDTFRITLAKQAIANLYRDKNFPYAHVTVDSESLTRRGELYFDIMEGPWTRIRKIDFYGNKSFTWERLRSQIESGYWGHWIFNPGKFDPETIDDDAAKIQEYYHERGFFDARVSRKIKVSRDMSELEIDFVIDEGKRYKVDRVIFKGNSGLPEAELRKNLKMVEGIYYEAEAMRRDTRELVRAYSPLGYIYQTSSGIDEGNPDYLRINARPVFRKDAGLIDLVWEIHEGKTFKLGQVIVKGNSKTQDKVILREMHVAPGQLYNAAEVADARDRLQSLRYFDQVNITPIGDDPNVRDVLVEVRETKTADFQFGGSVNSNGGLGGSIVFNQRNFDFQNWPNNYRDLFSDRAFTGAGQGLQIVFEPGTQQTNFDIAFNEPYIFDQPYSFDSDAYFRTRHYYEYDDTRVGGRIGFGKRFDYNWRAGIFFRGEDVNIKAIQAPLSERAPEILAGAGHTTLTAVGANVERRTAPPGFFPWYGSRTRLEYSKYGLLGGEVDFSKFSLKFDKYQLIHEDLLDRRTILNMRFDAGWDLGDSPFFERFYAGGLGSVRGFRMRGISPRSGLANDPVGGDFFMAGSAELGFPIAGDSFRGVVFVDAGDVEPWWRTGTIRTAAGAGIRLMLPIFGQAPVAVDLAWPMNQSDQDDTTVLSFFVGVGR